MSTPFDDESEVTDAPADSGTPGDPTSEADPEGSLLDDPASENQFGGSPQELQGDDPASGGS